jgi:hypothetical protein
MPQKRTKEAGIGVTADGPSDLLVKLKKRLRIISFKAKKQTLIDGSESSKAKLPRWGGQRD